MKEVCLWHVNPVLTRPSGPLNEDHSGAAFGIGSLRERAERRRVPPDKFSLLLSFFAEKFDHDSSSRSLQSEIFMVQLIPFLAIPYCF
jgi:hypothetical protein